MSKRKKGKNAEKKNWLPVTLLATGVLFVIEVMLFLTAGNKAERG